MPDEPESVSEPAATVEEVTEESTNAAATVEEVTEEPTNAAAELLDDAAHTSEERAEDLAETAGDVQDGAVTIADQALDEARHAETRGIVADAMRVHVEEHHTTPNEEPMPETPPSEETAAPQEGTTVTVETHPAETESEAAKRRRRILGRSHR